MPYITQEAKERVATTVPETAGELNFRLTMEIIGYLIMHGLSYQTCNDIVGALDNCKDEFKRRVQNPYEDKAIERNGDVYASC